VSADRTGTTTSSQPAAEQEVDLGRYWWAIVARWWLVVLCVAIGVLIGYLVSLGGGRLFQAKTTVYLGQPLTATGSAQLQGLGTNPTTVNQIVKSESVVRAVADEVGVDADELRAGISTRAVSGAVARQGQTQLVEVSVRGPWRRQSADAANMLGETVVERVSAYPDAKIELLESLLTDQQRELEAIDASIDGYRAAIESDSTLEPSERLLLVSLLGSAEQERGRLVEQKTQTELSLAVAQEVERASVVTRAAASRVAARSRSTSMIVGAVIGLLVGVVLALLWEPIRARLTRSREAAA
jgi:capsular polysaccharide biosynthesis protein